MKLVFNLLVSTLVVVAVRPGVNDMAEQARNQDPGLNAGDLIFPSIVSPTLLMVTNVGRSSAGPA